MLIFNCFTFFTLFGIGSFAFFKIADFLICIGSIKAFLTEL